MKYSTDIAKQWAEKVCTNRYEPPKKEEIKEVKI